MSLVRVIEDSSLYDKYFSNENVDWIEFYLEESKLAFLIEKVHFAEVDENNCTRHCRVDKDPGENGFTEYKICILYTSPSTRD